MDYRKINSETTKRIDDLEVKPGDVFTEMFSYWELILDVTKNSIVSLDNRSWEIKTRKKKEWQKYLSYNSIKGHWVSYVSDEDLMIAKIIGSYIKYLKKGSTPERDVNLFILIFEDYERVWEVVKKYHKESICQ